MKNFLLVALVALAVQTGMEEYEKHTATINYIPVTVSTGETVWSISEKYFSQNKVKMNFLEYVDKVRNSEKNSPYTKKTGCVMAGDLLYVPIYK